MKRIAIIVTSLIFALVVLAVPVMAYDSKLFPIGPEPIPNVTEYGVDVDTTPLGPDSWKFSYTIHNYNQGSAAGSGFDGFRILIPNYSEPYNITLPAPYSGSPGYWTAKRLGPYDSTYDVFQFWGENQQSVYPAGTNVTFSFEIDGVTESQKNHAALVSYFKDRADANPDNQNAWYVNFSISGGVISPTPSASHALLKFYQDSIESHSLYGIGKNDQEKLQREKTFENMLQNAVNLIAQGDAAGAVQQLWSAYYKVDSKPNPPDFISGIAKYALADKIMAAIDSLSTP